MGHSSKYQIHSYYASVAAQARTREQEKAVSVADVLGGLFTLALGSGLVGFAVYVLSTVL